MAVRRAIAAVHLAQLQQSEGRLHLVHLAVDAGRHHGHFVGKAEVLQDDRCAVWSWRPGRRWPRPRMVLKTLVA
jgi:hypothetical protein